jgi:hypothetical protein
MGLSAASLRSRAAAAVPFRRALALLVAGIGLLGLLGGCGSASGGEEAKAASEAGGIPGLPGVKSGEIEAALSMRGPGAGDHLYMRILGPFLGATEGSIPSVDLAIEANGQMSGKKVDFYTALINGPHRAAVTYEGKVYEMAPKTFDPLRSSFEQALGDGSAGDMYACLEAAARIDVSQIAGETTERDRHGKADDGARVTMTTTELEPSTMSAALRSLTEDRGCGAQLGVAGPLREELERAASEFERGAREAEMQTFVDDNGLLRELRAKAVLGSRGEGGIEAELVYSISHVNEVEELPPCTGEKAIEALFHELGLDPLKAIEAGEPGLGGLLEGIYAGSLA